MIESSRDRRKSGRCVLEGAHLIDVYTSRIGPPETLVIVDDRLDDPAIATLVARVPSSRVLALPRTLYADVGTLPPDVAALAVVTTPRITPTNPGHFCLLLEDVQDPGNVGSMIRSAAAAGVDQVVLSAHCAFAWSPKVLRAGQGAHFLTALIEGVDAAEWADGFRGAGGRLVATVVSAAPSVYAVDLCGRIALAIGSEGAGLSPGLLERCDMRVAIPMAAGSESLNAAAAAAIVMFEATRQRTTTP